MRLAPNRVPDADGLYLVTRSGPPVEEGGDMRDGSPGVDPLDPLGRPEAALELPGCPACRALPSLEAELVGWSTQGEVPVACPICEDLEASAANRLYLLLTKLGPAALTGAPASWRPCLPHLERLRLLRLERWLARWA